MPIQYTAVGFEPTIFRTLFSSHNHWTWAPALAKIVFNMEKMFCCSAKKFLARCVDQKNVQSYKGKCVKTRRKR